MHCVEGGWQMGWMAMWWLLIPLVIVLMVLALPKGLRGPSESTEPPERVLKRRYASGEIDRETYLRMLSDVTSTSP